MSNDSLEQNLMSNRNGGGCGIGRTERLCSMSGYNLLSENEKKLVSSLNMKPTLYITFKTFLIKVNNIYIKTLNILNDFFLFIL